MYNKLPYTHPHTDCHRRQWFVYARVYIITGYVCVRVCTICRPTIIILRTRTYYLYRVLLKSEFDVAPEMENVHNSVRNFPDGDNG